MTYWIVNIGYCLFVGVVIAFILCLGPIVDYFLHWRKPHDYPTPDRRPSPRTDEFSNAKSN